MSISYQPYQPSHVDEVIALGNQVHGDNYLDQEKANKLWQDSLLNGVNASWVALDNSKLIGFRLTQAAGNWLIDKWSSPALWQLPSKEVCYFKCNTVDERYRGQGIGSEMLRRSVDTAKQQGAKAGIAHIWLDSPGNSAFGYFQAAGGEIVKKHLNRWQSLSIDEGYICPICGELCTCTAAEMILRF